MMFDYKKCFDDYCSAHNLALHLSFSMPAGYETANEIFDPACRIVFINAERLKNESDSAKAFFFHELRHALQYLCPDQFSSTIQRSIQYIILYDGTCYKLANGRYLKCQLDGGTCWDIGYCIHPTRWRQGYAKEMVTAVVAFGAQNGVKTFLADVAAKNLGSCAVMCALGFTPTENGTFHRGSTTLEYKNLTFKKEL